MKEIFKAASQTGGGAIATMLLTVITGKVIALLLGPRGVGLFALTQQVHLTALGLATFGGVNALVQGVASREGEARNRYLASIFWLFVGATLVASLILVAFAPLIASSIAGRDGGISAGLIRWIALPMSLGVLFSYLSAVLNGFRAIGRLAVVKVVGAVAMTLLAYPACLLVLKGHDVGFAWLISSSMLAQGLLCFITARREGWLRPLFSGAFAGEAVRHFFSIAGALLVTAQIANVTMLAINALLIRRGALAGVGIFNAAWTLSINYILLILTSFSTYYLPTLSCAKSREERINVIGNVFRLTTLTVVPLLTALIVLKPLVVTTLYSGKFTDTLVVIRWMLIGNYLRVFAWVFATPAVANADMRVYFWTESAWSLGFLSLSALSILGFGSIQGIGIAFIVLYAAYLAYYVSYVRKRQGFVVQGDDRKMWLIGLTITVAASIYNWNSTTVEWISASLWMLVAMAFSWFVLKGEERHKIVLMVRARMGEVV